MIKELLTEPLPKLPANDNPDNPLPKDMPFEREPDIPLDSPLEIPFDMQFESPLESPFDKPWPSPLPIPFPDKLVDNPAVNELDNGLDKELPSPDDSALFMAFDKTFEMQSGDIDGPDKEGTFPGIGVPQLLELFC